jgi:hypothetical protein
MGEVAVSGGFRFPGRIVASHPSGQHWVAEGVNDLSYDVRLFVYAYCSDGITTQYP